MKSTTKYLLVKRRSDADDADTYTTEVDTDAELIEHLRGTFDNTNHVLISVVRTQP